MNKIETLQFAPFLAFLHLRFWDQNSFAESVLELIGMEMEELGRSGGLVKQHGVMVDGVSYALGGMRLEVSSWKFPATTTGEEDVLRHKISCRINGINSADDRGGMIQPFGWSRSI